MRVLRHCELLKTDNIMELPLTLEEWSIGIALWRSGALIQNAFPTLSNDEREFIMTGLKPGQ